MPPTLGWPQGGDLMPNIDEAGSNSPELPHPLCPNCNVAMWMTRVDHFGSADEPHDRLHYECKVCGATTVVPAPSAQA